MRSGVGLVRLVVPPDAVAAVQAAEPYALAQSWRDEDNEDEDVDATLADWANVVLLGPGLGRTEESHALARRILSAWRGPVVIDADGLNVFEGDVKALGRLCTGRPALLTPHVAEAARLLGISNDAVGGDRYEAAARLARLTGAAVLMKGVPTVITRPNGITRVSATGTPVLAAAGSGDILAGIAAALMATIDDPAIVGACAAWVHGRAGEIATRGRAPRGVPLMRVLESLEAAWTFAPPPPSYPVLFELPAVAET
jgi:ADP-dependent NAD(P)H-hydrate dehydratase / NAD(P)H-hydrate epimerase